jgi:hypothetical protein
MAVFTCSSFRDEGVRASCLSAGREANATGAEVRDALEGFGLTPMVDDHVARACVCEATPDELYYAPKIMHDEIDLGFNQAHIQCKPGITRSMYREPAACALILNRG